MGLARNTPQVLDALFNVDPSSLRIASAFNVAALRQVRGSVFFLHRLFNFIGGDGKLGVVVGVDVAQLGEDLLDCAVQDDG